MSTLFLTYCKACPKFQLAVFPAGDSFTCYPFVSSAVVLLVHQCGNDLGVVHCKNVIKSQQITKVDRERRKRRLNSIRRMKSH